VGKLLTHGNTPASPALGWLCRNFRLVAVAVFLGLLWLVYAQSGLAEHFDLPSLRQAIAGHESGGLLIFIGLFALGNLLQVPGLFFLAAAVLTLGAPLGGVVTWLAACITCCTTFLLIRLIGGNALREFRHPWAAQLFRRLDAAPALSVAGLRLMFQTMPALNYALALSGIRFRHYALGTLIGLPLPILAYCVFFDAIATTLGVL